jgi:hypothetical protein
MAARPPRGTIFLMNATPDTSRRVLVPVASSPSAVAADLPRVRRYRLARLPLDTRPDPNADRFAHLRRCYD